MSTEKTTDTQLEEILRDQEDRDRLLCPCGRVYRHFHTGGYVIAGCWPEQKMGMGEEV